MPSAVRMPRTVRGPTSRADYCGASRRAAGYRRSTSPSTSARGTWTPTSTTTRPRCGSRRRRASGSAYSDGPTSGCLTGAASTARRLRHDMIARSEAADITEPTLQNEPTENSESAEPIDPIERTDPTDPIERTEPFEPTERTEFSDR